MFKISECEEDVDNQKSRASKIVGSELHDFLLMRNHASEKNLTKVQSDELARTKNSVIDDAEVLVGQSSSRLFSMMLLSSVFLVALPILINAAFAQNDFDFVASNQTTKMNLASAGAYMTYIMMLSWVILMANLIVRYDSGWNLQLITEDAIDLVNEVNNYVVVSSRAECYRKNVTAHRALRIFDMQVMKWMAFNESLKRLTKNEDRSDSR